ncbi:secreted protein [Beggiatoa sp. PS]|nr:secreted protein [Beggiatoa sp. PS]
MVIKKFIRLLLIFSLWFTFNSIIYAQEVFGYEKIYLPPIDF